MAMPAAFTRCQPVSSTELGHGSLDPTHWMLSQTRHDRRPMTTEYVCLRRISCIAFLAFLLTSSSIPVCCARLHLLPACLYIPTSS
jgi:hypothetical protein